MNSENFADFGALFDHCVELRARLEEARKVISDDDWAAMSDGPFGEILCAAMDVEYWVDECERV